MNKIQLQINPIKIFILIFSIFGMFLSAWLWRYKLISENITCTVSGCQEVATGEYSMFLKTPVAAFGFFYYAFLTLLFFERLFIRDKILNILINIFLFCGWIFTIYLRYLEIFKIHDWCEWCWMSVLFMVVITISTVYERKLERAYSG